MKTITIKNIPNWVHQKLKVRAETHKRSLNQEVLTLLEKDLFPEPVNAQNYLASIRDFRQSLSKKLTAKEITQFKKQEGPQTT